MFTLQAIAIAWCWMRTTEMFNAKIFFPQTAQKLSNTHTHTVKCDNPTIRHCIAFLINHVARKVQMGIWRKCLPISVQQTHNGDIKVKSTRRNKTKTKKCMCWWFVFFLRRIETGQREWNEYIQQQQDQQNSYLL